MLSLGQGARYFQCGVMNAVVVCAAFAIGVRWGAIGVAAAYSIGTYLGLYPNLWWALRDSPVRVRDLARSVAFPVLVSLAVGLATFVVRKQLGGAGAYVQLAALGVTYGATMLAVVFALPGGRSTRELIADVRAQFRTTKA
jgi:PST family polysaccharide transporter